MHPSVLILLCLTPLAFAGPVAHPEVEGNPKKEAAGDQEPSDSSVHYDFDRHYGYGHSNFGPLAPYHAPLGIAHAYRAPIVPVVQGYGYQHKHGFHHSDGLVSDFGYEREARHGHTLNALPVYSGYVPTYGHTPGLVDHSHGYAYGHDAIGHFDHFTGPFGPFGFYANFYHDRR